MPVRSAWQSDFSTWDTDRTIEARPRVADADLRQPNVAPTPRDRNTPVAKTRPSAEVPPLESYRPLLRSLLRV